MNIEPLPVTFRTEVDGRRLVRCYSLSSSPVTDEAPKVTIKRVDEGRVSNWMNDHVAAGDELEVMKPSGVFCLQARDRDIRMFSGGSGITPCISIIKTALTTTDRRIHLLYANRDERSIIFRRELDELAAAHPGRLAVTHRLDDREGFATRAVVEAWLGGATGADFYVCGPGPFMDVVEGALQGLGVPEERIFIERFESPEDPDIGASTSGVSAPEGASVVVIHLDGVRHEVHVAPDETILHAARAAGLEPPFACEEGYCGCCMAKVKDGEVQMRMNDGGVDDAQIADGWVLTCQSEPRTPAVEVEYPD